MTYLRRKIKSVNAGKSKGKQGVVLYPGDCRTLLRKIKTSTVDLVVTSPPYCMGKVYEKTKKTDDFIKNHAEILPEIVRITKKGGSICWQVGYHVKNGAITPLDFLVHDVMKNIPGISLRNRIIWSYGHGLHCSNRFSGRHEVILWYTKNKGGRRGEYTFNLDQMRVPQKYPGKRCYKGKHKGQYSGNPLGKNPSDVWELPNVKANHPEKTIHPCQYPVALAQRLVKGLTPKRGVVFDPFAGVGSTGVAAVIEKRRFIGAEINKIYYKKAVERIKKASKGELRIRNIDLPILKPTQNMGVARKPAHFL